VTASAKRPNAEAAGHWPSDLRGGRLVVL